MLDIKFIKENKDIVASACVNKKKQVDLDLLISLYDQKKLLRQKLDEINQKRNEAAKSRNVEEGIRLKKLIEDVEKEFADVDKQYLSLALKVPNVPSPDTPVGPDESANKVIRQWGDIPQFDFKPKEHFEIGADLGIIDSEKAAEISGSRFTYLKGDLVRLEFALLQHCLEILTSQDILEKIASDAGLNVKVTPFIPILPPVFVKTAVQNRMARFLSPEEHYMFPEDDLMLVGSAEHTLGPIHMDEILDEKELPIRYVGYSTAFRREAGTYGKDTRGILRQHQFDKMEMEVFSLPENGMEEQNFLVAIQEYIMKSLNLPYQVVAVSTGDMGFPDYRQIDVETYMAGQGKYRETHSSDNIGGFQARRLNTRVKRSDGKIEHVHMNDATVVSQRPLLAIIENFQTKDGTVQIPEVLRKYISNKTHIEKVVL